MFFFYLGGSTILADLSHLYETISCVGGTKFWFHGFRSCIITVAERDLLSPFTLSKLE